MSHEQPLTMHAMKQETFGGPEVLEYREVPRPAPGISEVLIRVVAAGLNPTDWKHRQQERFLGQPPYTLGWDVAGVVEKVGLGVTIWQPGDEVFGMLPYPYGAGSHAEYVIAPARSVVRKPESIDMVQAGALPLASLTAWQALLNTAGLSSGQRVLIHGAAGGVGHIATQIAKAQGAFVLGTASAPKHDFLRSNGVDQPIDYHSEDFVEAAGQVDVVFDTIGGDYQLRSLRALKPGGTLVSIVPVAAPGLTELAAELGVDVHLMLVESDQAGMHHVAELVESGKLRAEIAATFPLGEAARAHEMGETNRTTGKIVLTVATG